MAPHPQILLQTHQNHPSRQFVYVLPINTIRLLSRGILLNINLLNLAIPAKRILDLAQLDAFEGSEEFETHWARLLGRFGDVGGDFVVCEAGDGADGNERCGCASGHDFAEGGEFFVLDLCSSHISN
jgi:hypothetical protein